MHSRGGERGSGRRHPRRDPSPGGPPIPDVEPRALDQRASIRPASDQAKNEQHSGGEADPHCEPVPPRNDAVDRTGCRHVSD